MVLYEQNSEWNCCELALRTCAGSGLDLNKVRGTMYNVRGPKTKHMPNQTST